MSNEKTIGTPWRAEVCDDRGPIVVEQDGGLVALCNTWSFMDTPEQAKARFDLNVAKTRRIVACVNACEGISTTDLVALDGTGILAKANHNADVVKKQRDQLLAALEAIIADDYAAPHDANDTDISREKGLLIMRMRRTAVAAIAASKAGAV